MESFSVSWLLNINPDTLGSTFVNNGAGDLSLQEATLKIKSNMIIMLLLVFNFLRFIIFSKAI